MPTKTPKPAAFTDDEKAAMKERARELKAEERAGKTRAEGESDLLLKIAAMPELEATIATRLHEIISAAAPILAPKIWYGMPAYVNKNGKVVCFFQSAQKFGTRYSTLGFGEAANLDDGEMWPTAFALKQLTDSDAERIIALIIQAAS